MRKRTFLSRFDYRLDVISQLQQDKRAWARVERRAKLAGVSPEEYITGMWLQWERKRDRG